MDRLLPLTAAFTLPDIERCLLESYAWFLEKTGVPKTEQEGWIADEARRNEAFEKANRFGDKLFDLVQKVAADTNNLRYLVV